MSWVLTIRGEGPIPTLTFARTDPQPPVTPVPPPVPPPPVVPADNSPFTWPPQPAGHDDPAQRYQALDGGAYAGAQEFQNPLPGSHLYAGDIQVHVRPASWDIFGWRLWAPSDMHPAVIRRLLATGVL